MTFSESGSIFLYIISYIISIYFVYRYYKGREVNDLKKIIVNLILSATPFSLICALRSVYCGYDSENYIEGFYFAKLTPNIDESIEYVYSAFRYATLQIFGDHRIFLFLIAAIPIMYYVVSVAHVAKNAGLCALGVALYMLYVSPIMLDQSRQFIAICMGIYALIYLINGKIKPYIILTIIASLCHESALSLFSFFVMSNKTIIQNKKIKVMFSLLIIISAFYLNLFTNILFTILPSKYIYIESDAYGNETTGLAWIADVFPVIFSMILYYVFRRNINKKLFILEICALSALPFRLAGYISFFIMRMSYYGEVAGILLLIITLGNLPKQKMYLWGVVSILVFFAHWYVDFVIYGLNRVIPYAYDL